MLEAFGWGALGAAALLVGALVAYLLDPSRRVIAVVMAVGTGLLIGSVSFELVDDALEHQAVAWVALMVLCGAAVFTVGNWLLDRRGGGDRKDADGAQAKGSPLAIVLGSVLDGIPESFVLGLTVLQGGVSISLLAAVALSNLPEGMSSSSGLKEAGWPRSRVLGMWPAAMPGWSGPGRGAWWWTPWSGWSGAAEHGGGHDGRGGPARRSMVVDTM